MTIPRGTDVDDVRVTVDGDDVTDAFEAEGRTMVGLVDGLDEGENRLHVASTAGGARAAPLRP